MLQFTSNKPQIATFRGHKIFAYENLTFSLHLAKFLDQINSDSVNTVHHINSMPHFT